MCFCVCLQLLEASIRPDTSLVSVMTVNNEIGVKQPIQEIGNHANTTLIFISHFIEFNREPKGKQEVTEGPAQKYRLTEFYLPCPQATSVVLKASFYTPMPLRLLEKFPSMSLTGRLT